MIFSIFSFWSEFWLQSYLLEVVWGGDKSSKFFFGKCLKMNPSKVPAALDPFGWVWKHYTLPKSVPVKKFKITWSSLIFFDSSFWSEFWLRATILRWREVVTKAIFFGKCHKMNPSKVPAALDPFGWVWKHYTHPKSVPVKKFKITWPPLIFSIFPFWSEFWLHIACCCFSSEKLEKCVKNVFFNFFIVFELFGVPKWY